MFDYVNLEFLPNPVNVWAGRYFNQENYNPIKVKETK